MRTFAAFLAFLWIFVFPIVVIVLTITGSPWNVLLLPVWFFATLIFFVDWE